MSETRIIIKKKGSHGGHHGGAWKVAYADFVTAMMALFIVLWLMNTSKPIQEAVGGYFRDPNGTSKLAGTDRQGPPSEKITVTKDNMSLLRQELQKTISKLPDFDKISKQVEMTVTDEGLRIELLESEKGTFFDLGSPKPSQNAKELLTALALEIGKVPNRVSIEGHTDSKPYGGEGYSNWELSVDRANAARRIMCQGGLSPSQVSQVRGYADQRLRYKDKPEDPGNRRISLIVEYSSEHAKESATSGDNESKAPPTQADQAVEADKKDAGKGEGSPKKESAPAGTPQH